MLTKCKITKFWDVNYKILARILATLIVLNAVNPKMGTPNCIECGALAGISHILLSYPTTKKICSDICMLMEISLSDSNWILGINSNYLLPLIWVVNFGVYKHHLSSFYGHRLPMHIRVENEIATYAPLFPMLHHYAQIVHDNTFSLSLSFAE